MKGLMTMAEPREPWNIRPAKKRAAVTASLKTEVETKARDLIENVLKPKHVLPPPKEKGQLHHRHRGEVVQGLLLLLHDLRLPKSERPLAHVRVDVCSNGTA